MGRGPSRDYVRAQYADAGKLQARIDLHRRFSTNKLGWYRWVFDQLDVRGRCRVLELGCGPGRLWRSNCERIPPGWRIVLTDFSPGMIPEARRNVRRCNRPFALAVGDVQDLPFREGEFDAVIANHMLYHAEDLERALSEIRRVLRAEGRLYAATNGHDNLKELREMVRQVAPGLPFGDNVYVKPFSLENGGRQLERHFSNVVRHDYENSLAVTEVEPLAAYVSSTFGAESGFAPDQAAALRRLAAELIESDGVMQLTLSTGLFVAFRGG
ncbi:MAG: class I SAM-dependent methyltransferase [Phycisphaerae bacterium]|nr:class I SAM-dependent methyltransferase [Phycisphaerae bacterium]